MPAKINEEICAECGACVRVCPVDAITVNKTQGSAMVNMESPIPVIPGTVIADDIDRAIEYINSISQNTGRNPASAAVEMLSLISVI